MTGLQEKVFDLLFVEQPGPQCVVTMQQAPTDAEYVTDVLAAYPGKMVGRQVTAEVPFRFIYLFERETAKLLLWVSVPTVAQPGDIATITVNLDGEPLLPTENLIAALRESLYTPALPPESPAAVAASGTRQITVDDD
jgi:hypothetical protein